MLTLITGLPGASKTLNAFKSIIEDSKNVGRQKFYHNVKLLMLDIDVIKSFEGWFYGFYYPSIDKNQKRKYDRIISRIHQEERFVSLEDFPHLRGKHNQWTDDDTVKLFLTWCRKLYPAPALKQLNDYIELTDAITLDDIMQFNLHFQRFDDPTLWYELPRSSVIFIDEVQDFFPSRDAKIKMPEAVKELAQHRHKGWDLYFLTQHTMLIDTGIRRQVGRHIHYYNSMNTKVVTRYEKAKLMNEDRTDELHSGKKQVVTRDSRFYGLYWSADKHTHKPNIPKSLLMLPLVIGVLVFMIYYLFNHFKPSGHIEQPAAATQNQQTTGQTKTAVVSQQTQVAVKKLVEEIKDIDHPLKSRCTKISYGGYVVTIAHGVTDVDHMINCVTDDMKTFKVEDGQGEKEEQEPKSYTYTENYLKALGYNIKLRSNVPILKYGAHEFILQPI